MTERIAVIGLGYVGLPVAQAFARVYPGTVGFDIDERRITSLRDGIDHTGEVSSADLRASGLTFSSNPEDLRAATFYAVAVPTPIDKNNQPDLRPLLGASQTVGEVLKPGDVVVYESTVYPGLTEEVCGPALERASGLRRSVDFTVGYSPERINPGDTEHTFDRIVKVVAGEDAPTLERVAAAYGAIVPAGIHRASSIKVAEAAKVVENTQRDLNIALMNELAIICSKLDISTREVLQAAGTKWNFLPFTPGLVGGHCIGVDPYYLTHKAQELGYQPQVILAGRQINDSMGAHVARAMVKMLSQRGHGTTGEQLRVGILGLTFKENVADIRNSRVPDIIRELRDYGIRPMVHDPLANANDAAVFYGIELVDWGALQDLDGVLLVVPHRWYLEMGANALLGGLRPGGAVFDVKSVLEPSSLPSGTMYAAL